MDTTVFVDTTVLTMVAGLFLPLITGIVTKLEAGSGVKAVCTAVLAVVTGIISAAIANPEDGIRVVDAGYAILFAFVSAAASYREIWKPTGVAVAVQTATKDFGV